MLLRHRTPFKQALKKSWITMTLLLLWTTGLVYMDLIHGVEALEIDPAIPAILGTAISLFLGFVTASAYDRWWEARKLWGAIVNDSRSWGRQVKYFLRREDTAVDVRKRFTYRQIAWVWSLSHWLREEDSLDRISPFLKQEEADRLKDSAHIPNSILFDQSEDLRSFYEDGTLTDYQYVEMEQTLRRLTDHMGGCERIKKTVFPKQYSFFIHLLIVVFMFMLPLGLIFEFGWLSIVITLGLGFLFLLMETIETNMQTPFENLPNDTAMSAISRTIEINLRYELGEVDLPEPIQEKNGILY
jgi:putative membrane protein